MNSSAPSDASAGFRKRAAAAWIDGFVVYAIATALIALGGMTGQRIALEPLFILVGAIHGVAGSGRVGRTIGKTLAGIAVTPRTGSALQWRQLLMREAVGKWGIGVGVPVALCKVLLEHDGATAVTDTLIRMPGLRDAPGVVLVPVVFEALGLLAALLLQLVWFLVAKGAWYDQLAGTRVQQAASPPRRLRVAATFLAGAAILGPGTQALEYTVRGRLPCRLSLFHGMRPTAPHEAFLARGQASPVDYILDLFDRHDVVVLCERLHPESSQWDFIYQLVSDPRFIDRVGHVFTEYGQVDMQAYLDRFMAADGLTASEIHERAVHLMRHWPVWPVWNNTNFYTYLTRLYALNQTQPPGKRIHHHFTDVSVRWTGLTREEYWAYRRSLGNRDEQMARRVITTMERLTETATKAPKCLVVMNYRHAFDLTGRTPAAERFNTFEFLKDAFGERSANVLLNTRILLSAPIASGTWDAAFKATGNRPAGFDLDDSPFGHDPFDLFPFRPELKQRLKYGDVFTGLAFTQPQEEQYIQHGIPGYFAGFEEEALRRAMFIGEGYRRIVETLIDAERRGEVARREPIPDHEWQVAVSLLGLASAGLLIGLRLFTSGRQARHRPREE